MFPNFNGKFINYTPYSSVATTGIPGASLSLAPRRDIDRHVSPFAMEITDEQLGKPFETLRGGDYYGS